MVTLPRDVVVIKTSNGILHPPSNDYLEKNTISFKANNGNDSKLPIILASPSSITTSSLPQNSTIKDIKLRINGKVLINVN